MCLSPTERKEEEDPGYKGKGKRGEGRERGREVSGRGSEEGESEGGQWEREEMRGSE